MHHRERERERMQSAHTKHRAESKQQNSSGHYSNSFHNNLQYGPACHTSLPIWKFKGGFNSCGISEINPCFEYNV